MPNNMKKRVLLIGTGNIAKEYMKVLRDMEVDTTVIGRGEVSGKDFEEHTGIKPILGGIEKYLKKTERENLPEYSIVAVDISSLANVAVQLMEHGAGKVLLEKPGCTSVHELDKMIACSNSNIYIAYNRRFYDSVKYAKRIIDEDGGVVSFQAEFTEWAHVIEKTHHSDEIKQKWFLMNSSHVMDLAFHLSGKPKEIKCFRKGFLDWHKAGSLYAGAGITEKGALFSYRANWGSAGSWALEINTKKNRLIFKPMELLKVQEKGSMKIKEIDLSNGNDQKYKAGLYQEVFAFLNDDFLDLCSLQEQNEMLSVYQLISGEEY